MKEKSLLQAILTTKCPQCREGNMYDHSVLDFKHLGKMNDTCPHCGVKFEREPGFFYGAMYVSYTLSVGIFICSVFVLFFLAGDPSLTTYILTISGVSFLLYPLNLRYSRVLFLYAFGGIKYKSSNYNGLSS